MTASQFGRNQYPQGEFIQVDANRHLETLSFLLPQPFLNDQEGVERGNATKSLPTKP